MARKKIVTDKSPSNEGDSVLTDILVDSLNKQLGDVAFILGKNDTSSDVKEWISTGSTVLDTIISNSAEGGGVPVGKLTEIVGEEATGKSLLSYMILKDCQDRGGIPVLIDTENAVNEDFLELLGMKLYPEGQLIYVQVDSVEKVFSAIENMIRKIKENRNDKLCCIVWDSIAGTSTKAEIQGEYGDSTIGLGARLIGQGLRKSIRFIGNQRIALVFLNQVREKIGGMVFGDPTISPGGKAVPFFSSVRVKLYSGGKVKAGQDTIGVGIKPKIIKNRLGPPHREAELKMYFNRGLIDEESWLDVLLKSDVAEKISAQKSAITNKESGELYEFKNTKFVEWIRKVENAEAHAYCKKMVKQSLIIEQDPDKREEEVTTESLGEDEIL